MLLCTVKQNTENANFDVNINQIIFLFLLILDFLDIASDILIISSSIILPPPKKKRFILVFAKNIVHLCVFFNHIPEKVLVLKLSFKKFLIYQIVNT